MESLLELCYSNEIVCLIRSNPRSDETRLSDKKWFVHCRFVNPRTTIYKAYGDSLEDLVEEATLEVKCALMLKRKERISMMQETLKQQNLHYSC